MSVEDKLISHTVEPYALLIKVGAVILVVGASLLVRNLKNNVIYLFFLVIGGEIIFL